MKKITFCFAFLACAFGFAQDTCVTATPVTPGTILGTTITDGSGGSEMSITNGDTAGNDSAWFAYTATGNGTINISTCLGGSDTRLYVGTGTCGALTVVDSNDDTCEITPGGNTWAAELIGVPVVNGTTYYIEFDDRWEDGTFDWTLAFISCTAPTVAYTVVEDCGNLEFSIDVDIQDMGDSASLTISTDFDSTTYPVTGTGIVNIGPFTIGTDVNVSIAHENNTDCDTQAGPFGFACPPPNDECAGAISLTPGIVYADNQIDASSAGATDSGFTNSCGGSAANDIWFTVVVPSDGNITIETGPDAVTGDTGYDSAMEAYTSDSDCTGTLTSVGCDDDGSDANLFSLLDLTGLTPGSTLYIRVWEFGGDQFEPFSISAYNALLSVSEFEVDSFKYFPNPVNDNLSLSAQSNIQNVKVFNILGQEVMRMSPNTLETEVNMTALSQGAYFVKVTINDVTQTIKILKK